VLVKGRLAYRRTITRPVTNATLSQTYRVT
jgi:hypothetical protein